MPVRNDAVEQACRAWGAERRKLLGLEDEIRTNRILGAIRSTLSDLRRLQDGAGHDGGKIEQHWPEVYVGDLLLVNRAWHALSPELKQVMDQHYAYRGGVELKADRLNVSRTTYLERVGRMRAAVRSVIAVLDQSPDQNDRKAG